MEVPETAASDARAEYAALSFCCMMTHNALVWPPAKQALINTPSILLLEPGQVIFNAV